MPTNTFLKQPSFHLAYRDALKSSIHLQINRIYVCFSRPVKGIGFGLHQTLLGVSFTTRNVAL